MSDEREVVRRAAGGGEYEKLRQRHVGALESLLPEYRARIDWSGQRLQSERLRALRALLSVAVERSPWHRERLAGIDPRDLCDGDVSRLPVMTKTDLMENFDAIVTDGRLSRELCERHLAALTGDAYLLDEYHVVASGGSSGLRGVFVYGWDEWAICYAASVRSQLHDWLSDPALAGVPRVNGVVAASKPTHISSAFSQTFSIPWNPRHLFPVSQPLQWIVSGLNQLQPTVLMGYSSFLPRLAREAQAGRLRISPRRVVAISEPLLPEARAAVRQAWGAPIANVYGMSEGVFAGTCRHGTMHLPDDLCLFEPVDQTGRAVAPGVTAQRVYITNLYNHTLPLIRYEVSDEVTVLDQSCRCGSAFGRIADPQGRLDDSFVYPGGVTIHPHVFRSALSQHPKVVEYQVRQTHWGADIQIVTPSPSGVGDLGHRIERALAALGVGQPQVTIAVVASLDRPGTGKLRRFIPQHAG